MIAWHAGLLLALLPAAAAAQDSLPPGLTERAVTVGPLSLPGTLTLPASEPRVPGVVLVQGSGAHDRDETIGPNKPFRDLAWGLAERGIAVLRYDKRTLVSPFSFLGRSFTVQQEVLEDAAAGIALLRAAPEVDSLRVVVLGHSLGGILAPRIAEIAPGTAGMIIMAGPTAPLTELILRQARYISSVNGSDSAQAAAQFAAAEQLVQQIQAVTPADSSSRKLLFGAPVAYWLDLRAVNPVHVADSLNLPMLILRGERDFQVTAEEAAGWKRELGARSNVTFHDYPGLNHLFLLGSGPGTPQEYSVPGHIPANVLDDIAGWVLSLKARPARHP